MEGPADRANHTPNGEVENPKFEARNPKQYPMIKIQMTNLTASQKVEISRKAGKDRKVSILI